MTDLPGWPRGLKEELAAAYVGLSASSVRSLVASGDFPAAVQLTTGRKVYLRDDLDRYLDRKAGRQLPEHADGREWLE